MYNGLILKVERDCLECGKKIIKDHTNRKFCVRCADRRRKQLKRQWKLKHYRQIYNVCICEICTKMFNSKRSNKLFCSVKCRNKKREIQRCIRMIKQYQNKINNIYKENIYNG